MAKVMELMEEILLAMRTEVMGMMMIVAVAATVTGRVAAMTKDEMPDEIQIRGRGWEGETRDIDYLTHNGSQVNYKRHNHASSGYRTTRPICY